MSSKGIIYVYEDGGMYCGEWEKDSAHGYGCGTGSGGRGKYEGHWENGDQICGVYTWPEGMQYMGQWNNNQRHGLGKESREDGSEYCGMFTSGAKGPCGTIKSPSGAYRGLWRNGKQDGEGEEVYMDKGCYRGQYKNGVRSGHGTRTSAAYEYGERRETLKSSTLESNKLRSFVSPLTLIKRNSSTSSTSLPTNLSELATSNSSTSQEQFNSQIYEGEWKNDKRHGHGTIKVIGSYTYYGQWVGNTRTGYGVLVYENGTKEEGRWQCGQLIEALKRKRLHLKTHQLQERVQSAHTIAIRAADTARNKAMLAEGKALSATAKSKSALSAAVLAEKCALLAREKAELYKNAPKISEGLMSPVQTPSHSDGFLRARESTSEDIKKMTFLGVSTDSVSHSSSFEDVRNIVTRPSSNPNNSDTDSETDFVDNKVRRRRQFEARNSLVGGNRTSIDDKAMCRFNISSSSDAETSFSMCGDPPASTRRFSNDPDLLEVLAYSKESRRRSVPETLVEGMLLEGHGEEGGYRRGMARGSYFKRRKRTKTTGELELTTSDDDTSEGTKKKQSVTRTASSDQQDVKNTLAVEILVNNLNQMANWNKMIAYINFLLLVFLMVMILGVVASMYYYQLVSFYHNSHSSDEHRTTSFMSPIA